MMKPTWLIFYQKTAVQKFLQAHKWDLKKSIEKRGKEFFDLVLGNHRRFYWQVALLRRILSNYRLKEHIQTINDKYEYNKALLCYNICWSLLASRFLSNLCLIPNLYYKIPAFDAKMPAFYANIVLFIIHYDSNVCGWVPMLCLT